MAYWSGRRDSNPRPPPWQGGVLPLNYFRIYGWGSWIRTNASRSQSPLPYRLAIPQCFKTDMGRLVGIEPTNARATIWCVNHFAIAAMFLAGAVGIEPTPEVLETSVLPLNYAPKMVEGDGFEPPNPKGADLQSAAFSHFATPPRMVPAAGLEPATY